MIKSQCNQRKKPRQGICVVETSYRKEKQIDKYDT